MCKCFGDEKCFPCEEFEERAQFADEMGIFDPGLVLLGPGVMEEMRSLSLKTLTRQRGC